MNDHLHFPHRPPFNPPFLDELEGFIVERWDAKVWRAVVDRANIRTPSQRGARWNPFGLEALYCALTADGASAELTYVLSRQPVPPAAKVQVYPLIARISRVMDLSDPTLLNRFAGPNIDFLGEDYVHSQHLGAAASFLGCCGLLIPSARYEGTNLVIFLNNLGSSDSVDEP